MKLPIITDRESYYYGEGFNRLDENGTIVLISKTVQDDKEFLRKFGVTVPSTSKLVRLHFYYYVFQIQPINETRCKIKAITNVNPHVKWVP